MTLARTTKWLGLPLALLTLNCDTELRPASYIETTEILTIYHEVELGPLDPDRVGPLIAGDAKPIAEILPGDQLRLEAVVVDTQGIRLAAHELETIWLQCGRCPCYDPWCGIELDNPKIDRPCGEHDAHTTDDHCRLGTGADALAFDVPALGPGVLYAINADGDGSYAPLFHMFVVVAWGGRRAEDCWNARRGDLSNLDHCGFIYHDVGIGPRWWVYAYASELGFDVPYEIDPASFPPQVFLQPANRIPRTPTLVVVVDGEQVAAGVPPFAPIPAPPGATIEVAFAFDPLSQLFQSGFAPLSFPPGNAFEIIGERLFTRTATSGAIAQPWDLQPAIGDGSLRYEVDPYAEPGSSRVLLLYRDEGGANDVLTLEFVHE